jgi:hypothetical protein
VIAREACLIDSTFTEVLAMRNPSDVHYSRCITPWR